MNMKQRNILMWARVNGTKQMAIRIDEDQEVVNEYNALCRHGYLELINHEEVFDGDAFWCKYEITDLGLIASNICRFKVCGRPTPIKTLDSDIKFANELADLLEKYDASFVPGINGYIQQNGRMIPMDYRNERFGAKAFRKCAKFLRLGQHK